jgi:hypothetical protein
MSERRPPDKLFESLLEYEHDDPDARPIAELTKEERDVALRSHGVDPDALRARGAAHAAEVLKRLGAPPPGSHAPHDAPAPPPAHLLVRTAWFWVPAVVVVAILARLLLGGHDAPPVPAPAPPETRAAAPPPKAADKLLIAARDACGRQAWADCLRALDSAHAEDPSADQGAEARALRDQATRELTKEQKAPAPERHDDKAPH